MRELVEVGDWLVAERHTDLLTLRDYVVRSHLDGVLRARDAASMVREGSESVRESAVRWAIVASGLPEPEINVDIQDALGRFLARGDLVYREWQVLVEYDGWHHERDALQRQRDPVPLVLALHFGGDPEGAGEFQGHGHPERDALQRQRDHLRREALEAAGWRVIVVTTADMRDVRTVVWRIHAALKARGFTGPTPQCG